MRVSADWPDDTVILHDALEQLRNYSRSPLTAHRSPLTLHLKNCGTALRFLQVHLARCYPGVPITLTGDPRLMERNGAPTSQIVSALLMHGDDIPYTPDESPYITMTRKLMADSRWLTAPIERDWSAAAFWYEYVAIHGGELLLLGLTADSIQGDRIVADIYARHFGVTTTFTTDGALLQKLSTFNSQLLSTFNIQHSTSLHSQLLTLNFKNTPDLYPAIALTCERLGITLHATGTERLVYKESNRLEAVARHETRHDHRMAMALLAADFPVDDTDCIRKSYPAFLEQWNALSDHHS